MYVLIIISTPISSLPGSVINRGYPAEVHFASIPSPRVWGGYVYDNYQEYFASRFLLFWSAFCQEKCTSYDSMATFETSAECHVTKKWALLIVLNISELDNKVANSSKNRIWELKNICATNIRLNYWFSKVIAGFQDHAYTLCAE